MPELPEVETTLRGVKPFLHDATISKIVVRNKSLRWPVPEKQLQSLVNASITSVERRAKYLLVHTNAGNILLHLGMSGSLRITDTGRAPGKHDHIDFELDGSKVLRFNDPRRFGCCLFISADDDVNSHKLLVSLGPEPMSARFDGDHLFKLSRKRNLAIKNFIMDGKIVVGVGNIYASESLFFAGIRPSLAAGRISRKRYQLLASAIKQVLNKAIEAGGTTLNDFSQADGKPGYFKQQLQVYGRVKEACFTCNTEIKSMIIGQRNTFYCCNCQKY
ncbi:MAG: bifunctional DNA-formamidopyrimidine glycosylase/DNA-(apurinic or apyrimidinic site) lyase [Acidiferrobacterales bacterium]|nr:bifunctional DNA-formamidopyrimidine glycosylase/DNA-(apurinic or apyrimidinic site) lyase [Acidiferrobacterales bacterium]